MLDIVIPCIDSDAPMLRLAVEGAMRCVFDGISRIYVVAPESSAVKDVCRAEGLEFVEETEMMGFGKDSLELPPLCKKGWVYQQLIKLGACALGVSEDFLVMDADHVLLRPHRFVRHDGYCFYMSEEYHMPYFKAIGRLFQSTVGKSAESSFVSDKMVMNRHLLSEMLSEIEARRCCPWHEAVAMSCSDTYNPFSEFETYGSWLCARHGSLVHTVPDGRRLVRRREGIRELTYAQLLERYDGCASVTEQKR